jgi:predicted lipid-binding transport protein (Tim44 family)
MKRLLSLLALVFAFGLSTAAMEAEAAQRMGSGKSLGTQRQATPDKTPATATPAAAAASPGRSWMGPVAGLAAGLGLAALASHLGFGDELASMVMMGLLAAAVMLVIGFVMRKRAAARQSTAAPQGMQYARVNGGRAADANDNAAHHAPAYKVSMPAGGRAAIGSNIGSGLDAASTSVSRIPADFDSAAFEHNARVQFVRLQAANDARDLNDIRQFTTPEMFAELQLEMAERGNALQKTEVVTVRAEVIEVDEDADRYLVSVRFTGVLRAGSNEPDESFDEIWHLVKPRQAEGGWLLSGIQQVSQQG